MAEQIILHASGDYAELDAYFKASRAKKIFLVCGRSIQSLRINGYFKKLESETEIVRFSGFRPNPSYESVAEGVELFRGENCDLIVAVGGGSAMDVAKCVKLFANMDGKQNYLRQEIVPNGIRLLAVPTTAGTGSEATRYAVIYFEGEKQSISDESCIPSAVLMDPSLLRTLPDRHRTAAMLDALCHGIESFWSVNSTEESRAYSRAGIQGVLANLESYLSNQDSGNAGMLAAANMAGKAINITQTTAGHAMCYHLTSRYGIAHGHAAALCVSKLWPYMVSHTEKCADPRGEEYLIKTFGEIARAMGCETVQEAVETFQSIVHRTGIKLPPKGDYAMLSRSVNPVRLKNNPVALSVEDTGEIYRQIFEELKEKESKWM